MATSSDQPPTKKYFDVSRPGKVPPSSTSRPTLVTNRIMLKDPMVTEDQAAAEAPVKPTNEKVAGETIIAPPDKKEAAPAKPEEKPEAKADNTETKPEEAKKPEPSSPEVDESVTTRSETEKKAEKELADAAAKQEAFEKIITDKTYVLPIHERGDPKSSSTKMLVVILVLLVLAVVAADLLLDAGIVKSTVRPATDFFKGK